MRPESHDGADHQRGSTVVDVATKSGTVAIGIQSAAMPSEAAAFGQNREQAMAASRPIWVLNRRNGSARSAQNRRPAHRQREDTTNMPPSRSRVEAPGHLEQIGRLVGFQPRIQPGSLGTIRYRAGYSSFSRPDPGSRTRVGPNGTRNVTAVAARTWHQAFSSRHLPAPG